MPSYINEEKMFLKRKYCISILFIAGVAFRLPAQDTLISRPENRYRFLDLEENRVHNSVSLSDFFEKLYRLKKNENYNIKIIHIGDSHLQADYLSRTVRQRFQADFGNAGRGLIVPYRVARTNEPANIVTSSTSQWEVKRCVTPELPMPIGIGGITIRTTQPGANLSIKTLNAGLIDYGFNKITLFFQKDITSFHVIVKDSLNEDIAFIGSFTNEPYPNTSTVLLPFYTHQVRFEMLPSTPLQTQATLFGINLQNGKPGVLYHAIGVNGAKFKNFLDASLFADQTAALDPDLFIISLGTNEALEYPYADPQFINQVDSLISRLRTRNPNAQFLITTPPDSFRRKNRRNTGIEQMHKKLVDYADLRNLAYWDLYEIGGGKHSADHWKNNHLMRADGIHFFVAGYELQGNLLYEALMKGYDEYVQYRHP